MRKWLAVAIALHASLLLLMRARLEPSSVSSVLSVPTSPDAEIELDLDASRSAGERAVRATSAKHSPGESRSAPAASRAPLFAVPNEPAEAGPSALTGEVAAPSVTTPAPDAPSTAIDLGIGADAWQRWLPRSADGVALRGERDTTPKSGRYQPFRAPPVSTTGGVQEGLEARTRALGLGPSGRVISAFHQVVAEEVMPNGLKTKELHGSRLEVTAPRFRSSDAQKAELKDRNPTAGTDSVPLSETKANVELPGVYVAGRGKVCGYRVGITLLGPLLQGGCDFAGAGTKPQRIVRATTHDEVLF